MLEQLLKFKSDVRLGRKEVVFNEICNVSEMRSTVFVKAKTEPRWKWSVRSAENLLPLSSKKMIYISAKSRYLRQRRTSS